MCVSIEMYDHPVHWLVVCFLQPFLLVVFPLLFHNHFLQSFSLSLHSPSHLSVLHVLPVRSPILPPRPHSHRQVPTLPIMQTLRGSSLPGSCCPTGPVRSPQFRSQYSHLRHPHHHRTPGRRHSYLPRHPRLSERFVLKRKRTTVN